MTDFKSRQFAEQMSLLDMKFFQNIEANCSHTRFQEFVDIYVLTSDRFMRCCCGQKNRTKRRTLV